ncbi:Phosphatidylglycerol/phosphatidylinositol transfer protein [Entomortierella chlamydospora]|uniref:Phosphatidylglycerol/phosphatidylinositol transfer protein n=1 Tax=Entomortierella chlamydospora TaxID=101097 RepID=A0A9P6MY29_9FUNG|nr:Phosphatidylglycerol/phosphatidylinositol transfer protein [Entomortierella chlamydospora]KAG0017444.1 Phosphatidylglycerol/phosphatidylinositol transfer protein [Entomortierella chlamydospora]
MKFIASAVAAIALATTVSADFTSCGSPNDTLTLSNVSYTPNPPKVGQQVCITLNGTLSAPVTQGSNLTVTATYMGFNVYSGTSDLCADLANSTTPCPIGTNVTSVTECVNVPSVIPTNATFNLQANATSASGAQIFCISGNLTFSS